MQLAPIRGHPGVGTRWSRSECRSPVFGQGPRRSDCRSPVAGERLRRLFLVLPALVLTVASRPAPAQVEGTARVTFFSEPSSTSNLRVIHPQGDVAANVSKVFGLRAGYDLDIVSGATPKVFGPQSGPDAVTAATEFEDVRHSVHGGFDVQAGQVNLGVGYAYGWEKDYRSSALTAAARADLIDKNFTLQLAYTHNFDSVCDANNRGIDSPLDRQALTTSEGCFDATRPQIVTERVAIDSVEPTLTWVVTPRLLLQGGVTGQVIDGFQSNPYRSVLVGSQHRTPQEHEPRYRQRLATFLRTVYALPALRASAGATARAYRDTWGVEALTGEIEVKKYIGKGVIMSGRGRAHFQRGAVFYRTSADYRSLGPAGQYWTGDRELAPMSNLLGGAKIAYLRVPERERSLLQEIEFGIKGEYLVYRLDSDDAPNADRKYALIGQAALALRF